MSRPSLTLPERIMVEASASFSGRPTDNNNGRER